GHDDVIAMDGRMLDELSKAQVPIGHAPQVRVVEDDRRPQTRGRPAGRPVDPAQEVDEREEPEEAAGVELVAQALPRGQLVGSGQAPASGKMMAAARPCHCPGPRPSKVTARARSRARKRRARRSCAEDGRTPTTGAGMLVPSAYRPGPAFQAAGSWLLLSGRRLR